MARPPLSVPLEIADLIVSLLDKENDYYIELLKNLSLVTPHFATATRSRLFQALVIRCHPRRPRLADTLLSIIRSNRLILRSIQELHLIIDHSMYLSTPGREVDAFLPIIRAAELSSIMTVYIVASGSPEPGAICLAPEVLDCVASSFKSLRRLQIENLTFHAQLLQFMPSSLQELELIHTPVLGQPVDSNRPEPPLSQVPRLRRIVAHDVRVVDKQESAWDETSIIRLLLERYQFTIDKLEEFGAVYEDNEHSPWILIDLNLFAMQTIRCLSLRVDMWNALLIHGNLFDRVKSIHTLTLLHTISVPAKSSRPANIFDDFDCFHPPLSVQHLSFAFTCDGSSTIMDHAEEWMGGELRLLDSFMASARCWDHLRTIEFKMLYPRGEGVDVKNTYRFPTFIDKSFMPSMTQRGIQISGLSNELVVSSRRPLEWPYYTT